MNELTPQGFVYFRGLKSRNFAHRNFSHRIRMLSKHILKLPHFCRNLPQCRRRLLVPHGMAAFHNAPRGDCAVVIGVTGVPGWLLDEGLAAADANVAVLRLNLGRENHAPRP